MKPIQTLLSISLAALLIGACDDGAIQPDLSPGAPTLDVTAPAAAHFGDNIPFALTVGDRVPLSVATAQLFYGEEVVATTTLRTREAGTYTGTIFAPYLQGVPDGNATLRFTLTDTHLTSVSNESAISLTRAQYPYLIFVTDDAAYQMLPTGAPDEYAATYYFPSTDIPGYIKTPVLDSNATELTFGWEGGAIVQGSTTPIPFASAVGGQFSITFNAASYQASPFFEILANGVKMSMLDKTHYQADFDLQQGDAIVIDGIGDLDTWWIDPDFLVQTAVGEYTFAPLGGRYRIIADLAKKYFRLYALDGDQPAALDTATGQGTVWVIGDEVGKPTFEDNAVGWEPSNGLSMVPIADRIYRITLVGGTQINTAQINFKLFYDTHWGGEFGANLTSTSSIVQVGKGQDVNGVDLGNLFLAPGTALTPGVTYLFTLDLTAGINNAVLSVEEK